MTLELLDSRRLTGPNLFWDRPGAVLDARIAGPAGPVIAHWECAARDYLAATGHAAEETRHRIHRGGASLVISAPIDALYGMCELNEAAWRSALHALGAGPEPDRGQECARLRARFEAERNPRLLELQRAARDRGLPFLWDDEEVSLGHGSGCRKWPRVELPAAQAVDWTGIAGVPLALVTGTNGKSTTVRMAAAILSAAGLRTGYTSTDFIRLDGATIETGDFSGTGGARRLLRQPGLQAAVLEVARGGLLRRGLGVERADAAVITNVAADHLGEYGIDTVEDLREAKLVVRRALGPGAPLILNADDAGLAERAKGLGNRIWWFSLEQGNPLVQTALAGGGGACWLADGDLFTNASRAGTNGSTRRLMAAAEVTASHGGKVLHNIGNALAAALLGIALGAPDEALREGLRNFRGDEDDNPGRGNWFEGRGVRILVDFAHNEHGLRALAQTVARLAPTRVLLMLGQAGDRSDEAIRGMARAACSMQPAEMLLTELPGYERGRPPGQVPALLRGEALSRGVSESAIQQFASPLAAARQALVQARDGDLLILLALTQRKEILELVHGYIDG